MPWKDGTEMDVAQGAARKGLPEGLPKKGLFSRHPKPLPHAE